MAQHLPAPARAVAALGVVALVGGLAFWQLRPPPSGPLQVSGTVEAEEVTLAAQMPGRVADLQVDEGASVSEGEVLGHLSDPVVEVQNKQSVADAAQFQVSQAQMSKLLLRAPQSGIVQKRLVHQGEFVGAGAPILTVADPRNLKLTLYVLEADLGRVFVGQPVAIRADAFGDRTFEGTVTSIATQAEFTPRNVQTPRDRQNLVFAVKVRVPNPDAALKAGLPVDATLAAGS
jgi:membrane fusion protein YbhG